MANDLLAAVSPVSVVLVGVAGARQCQEGMPLVFILTADQEIGECSPTLSAQGELAHGSSAL